MSDSLSRALKEYQVASYVASETERALADLDEQADRLRRELATDEKRRDDALAKLIEVSLETRIPGGVTPRGEYT